MTEPSTYDRASLRTTLLFAHHVESGRAVADSARICGMDPQMAEWMAAHWAFQLLMLLVPFFRVKARLSRPRTSGGDASAISQVRRRSADRFFSFSIRCDEPHDAGVDDASVNEDGANDTASHAATTSAPVANIMAMTRLSGTANSSLPRFSQSPEHPLAMVGAGMLIFSPASRIRALFAPLAEKTA